MKVEQGEGVKMTQGAIYKVVGKDMVLVRTKNDHEVDRFPIPEDNEGEHTVYLYIGPWLCRVAELSNRLDDMDVPEGDHLAVSVLYGENFHVEGGELEEIVRLDGHDAVVFFALAEYWIPPTRDIIEYVKAAKFDSMKIKLWFEEYICQKCLDKYPIRSGKRDAVRYTEDKKESIRCLEYEYGKDDGICPICGENIEEYI